MPLVYTMPAVSTARRARTALSLPVVSTTNPNARCCFGVSSCNLGYCCSLDLLFRYLLSAASIQDAADAANGSRLDLHDVVSRLLVAMRAATMNLTSPVVWPGCAMATPASPAFQQPKTGRVKAKPVQPIVVLESSSGEDSGWNSAGASRPPPEPSSLAGNGRARQ
ncbi:unnamed protein product [Ectocarpus sp. CCAP 1310/34]|nr:unnamed protein product [Ectocarpus sp. CCAP 1310/34]